jgi:hypothetical protein
VDGGRRIESKTTVRKHMGRILWWFANHDAGDDESLYLAMLNIQGDDEQGKIALW